MAPQRQRSYPITIILAVAIGGMVFLSTGLSLALSSTAAVRNTIGLLRTSGLLAMDSIEEATKRHLAPARDATGAISDLVTKGVVDVNDAEQVEGLFRGVLASSPQIAGIAIWDEGFRAHRMARNVGPHLTVGTATDDPSRVRLINALRQSGKVEWGPPIHLDGNTLVTVAKSLYRDGKYVGAVATGVSIDELSRFVSDAARGVDMTGFILYGDSAVLAHPEIEGGGRRRDLSAAQPLLPVKLLRDEVVRKFKDTPPQRDVRSDGFAVRTVASANGRYIVLSRAVQDFGTVPWQIGIYAPAANLTTELRRLVGSIGVGIGVLTLAVACALLLARRLARPINRIASASEQIGQLELDTIEPLPRSWITEIDQQAVAFNRMVEGLRWFETYVPRRLVGRLIAGGEDTATSRAADLTIMFTDIIGFTRLSERMAPEAVGAMLNEHFAVLGRCIEAEGGTLDKYIGDAVMAFWGAPEDQPDHAARACRAAIAIAHALEAAREAPSEHPPIRIKIGIHSGPVLVGNIGAPNRINYTVVGDAVNIGSRIESLCRDYDDGRGTIILVSQDAAEQASRAGDFSFTPVGAHAVKGRDEPVSVFRLDPN